MCPSIMSRKPWMCCLSISWWINNTLGEQWESVGKAIITIIISVEWGGWWAVYLWPQRLCESLLKQASRSRKVAPLTPNSSCRGHTTAIPQLVLHGNWSSSPHPEYLAEQIQAEKWKWGTMVDTSAHNSVLLNPYFVLYIIITIYIFKCLILYSLNYNQNIQQLYKYTKL